MPESVPTSVRAAVLGKGDRKRPAEFEPDDESRGDVQVERATDEMEMEASENVSNVERSNATTLTIGSALDLPPCADEAGRLALQIQDARWQPVRPKPLSAMQARHPSPKIRRSEVQKGDLEWRDIGSGVIAKTVLAAKRLTTTSKGGPPSCDRYCQKSDQRP